MSAFLGKIHYWLYNKIKVAEEIEKSITLWAEEQNNLSMDKWKEDIYNRYEGPLGEEPLEDIIDKSNIHGWLQHKINMVELRQAALITYLLEKSPESKEVVLRIFTEEGKKKGEEAALKQSASSPQDIYTILNEYILEGMPCDNVDRKIESTETVFSWLTTRCLHRDYWEEVGGNIDDFYGFREVWIKAFVESFDSAYNYEVKNLDGKRVNEIKAV